MKPTLVQIWANRNELEHSVAEKIIDTIRSTLTKNSRCCIALSGGETPKNVYRQLGRDEAKESVDWGRVHVFFCDERAVPPDHPDSNYRMIEDEWISHIPIPRENVHRMKGEIDPTIAAEEYEQEIYHVFGPHPVIFDLILLGVGADGHTASLFPGSDAVLEKNAFVKAYFAHQMQSWRITLTVPVINSAREILFLAAGRKKSAIVQRILNATDPDTHFPASLIHPGDGTLRWMIDQEAGFLLREHSSLQMERK